MKAFPQKYPIDASEPHHWINNPLDTGMDLRDYFAGKAMQGIVDSSVESGLETSQIAESAYRIADAMMEARNATI